MTENNSRTNFWDIAGSIINAGVIFLLVLIIMGVAAWLIVRGQNLRTAAVPDCSECPVCTECPDCATGAVVPEATESAPVPITDYVCNAVDLGNGGPVGESGSCKFCTINYFYPGDVIIAEDEPIAYDETAWVWQYNTTNDLDAFRGCIQGQPFYADSAYQPVWP